MVTINGFQLDEFTAAYLECMLWSSMDESDENTGGNPLDKNYGIKDIHHDSMRAIIADCNLFQISNGENFNGDYDQAGHDYWLTRNHHGAGYWAREYAYEAEQRDILTAAAHAAGERDAYIGDDGLIHITHG